MFYLMMKNRLKQHCSHIRNFCIAHHILLKTLIFSLLAAWLELSVHICDGAHIRYVLIYIPFGISLGFFFSAIGWLLKTRAARIYSRITACVLTVCYAAEFIAKCILQTYYPISSLKTAAENHLYQFIGIILETIAFNLHKLLFIFLGAIFILVFARYIYLDEADETIPRHMHRMLSEGRYGKAKPKRSAVICLACIFAFHYLGLAAVQLPIGDGLQPKALYYSDTNYNDQMEQLGLYNMVRLDVIHTLFPSTVRMDDEGDLDLIAQPLPGENTQTGESTQTADTSEGAIDEPEVHEIDRSPNAMDIDFAALSEGTKNKDIKWLCDYFNTVQPTNKNEYTGMFKGYNVVFVTIEAFDYLAVSEQYTPTLYKLMHEGFVFNNFYSALHFTSTSNGECQHLLGLYPKNGQPITMARTGELGTNCYFSLAQQLGKLGYKNYGYHNNWDLYERADSHKNLGYNWRWCGRGMVYEADGYGNLRWPQRDSFMVEHSTDTDDWLESDELFNIYYLTVSGHTPYGWNFACLPYREELADAPWTETTKAYIASVMEADRALEVLLKKLEKAGKLDNTLIIASPDHIPYTAVENMGELAGKNFGTSEAAQSINERVLDLELYRNGLIIWSASMEEPVQVDKVCCQVDILPTVSNLLGLEYDSRMLSGTDILSDSEGLVVFSSRCWRTDKGLYNRFTDKFEPNEGVEMTEEETKAYVERFKTIASCRLNMTSRIVENNFYDYVFGSEGRITGSFTEKTGKWIPPEPEPEIPEESEEDASHRDN